MGPNEGEQELDGHERDDEGGDEARGKHAELIESSFPKLNRCLTGYDLAHIRDADGQVNLNNILCGSEGSLGFIVEAKLNVLPIPQHAVLVNVSYASFMEALRDAQALMAALEREREAWHTFAGRVGAALGPVPSR